MSTATTTPKQQRTAAEVARTIHQVIEPVMLLLDAHKDGTMWAMNYVDGALKTARETIEADTPGVEPDIEDVANARETILTALDAAMLIAKRQDSDYTTDLIHSVLHWTTTLITAAYGATEVPS